MNYIPAQVIEPQRSYSILSDEYYLATHKFQTPTIQVFIWNLLLNHSMNVLIGASETSDMPWAMGRFVLSHR